MAKKEKQPIVSKNIKNSSQNGDEYSLRGQDFKPKMAENYEQLTFVKCEFFDIILTVKIYEFFMTFIYVILEFNMHFGFVDHTKN